MKKMKTKLFTTVAMLTVSAITLSTASYAWFTMQKTATVNEFSLTATAPSSIQIAEGHYVTETDNKWTTGAISLTQTLTGKLSPSSSVDGLSIWKINKDTIDGPVNDTTIPADTFSVVATGTTGYYIDIPLSFRTLAGEVKEGLKLDLTNSKISNSATDTTTPIYKTARVAFLHHTGTTPGTNAIPADVTNPIWAPLQDGSTTGTAVKAANGAAASALQKTFTGTTNTKVVPALAGSVNGKPGVPTEMTLRIWFEGQDSQCITSNAGGGLKITLAFINDTVAP